MLARLGIKPDEFGRMSPGYLNLVLRELDEAELQHYAPAAAIQAAIYNTAMGQPENGQPVSPWQFIPGWEFDIPEPERKIATPMDLRALLGSKPRGRENDGRRARRRI